MSWENEKEKWWVWYQREMKISNVYMYKNVKIQKYMNVSEWVERDCRIPHPTCLTSFSYIDLKIEHDILFSLHTIVHHSFSFWALHLTQWWNMIHGSLRKEPKEGLMSTFVSVYLLNRWSADVRKERIFTHEISSIQYQKSIKDISICLIELLNWYWIMVYCTEVKSLVEGWWWCLGRRGWRSNTNGRQLARFAWFLGTLWSETEDIQMIDIF